MVFKEKLCCVEELFLECIEILTLWLYNEAGCGRIKILYMAWTQDFFFNLKKSNMKFLCLHLGIRSLITFLEYWMLNNYFSIFSYLCTVGATEMQCAIW